MKSIGLVASVILALLAPTGMTAAATRTPIPAYHVRLLAIDADPTDQSPFDAGLIRGFARHGAGIMTRPPVGSISTRRNLPACC